MAVLTILLAIAAGHVIGWWLLIVNHRAMLSLEAPVQRIPDPAPLVSIVLPARDEATVIEACVDSLLAQDYPRIELIVVDDQSSDGTGEILNRLAGREPKLQVVHGLEPAPGWLGKNHALHQGTARASGEYLLFVDADVVLDRRCVRASIALAESTGADLLTLVPRLITLSFWERVIQPPMLQLVLFRFQARLINDPAHPEAASANGPFLLFRRAAYESIGGHAAVRADPVEDLALARRIKRSGHRLTYAIGTHLIRLRMYRSFREIWNGWSKNFSAGAGESLVLSVLSAMGLAVMFVLPWLSLLYALAAAARGVEGGTRLLAASLVAVIAALAWRRELDRRYALDAGFAMLQPLAYAAIIAILLNSAWLAVSGGQIRWKGRSHRRSFGSR